MSGRLHDKARSLSGGQMRRIEIARALLHRPPLLLLDEATVGLDVQSRAGILATIRKLVETDGISVFWATHLIDEVEDGDHVVVLRQGRSGRQRQGRRCRPRRPATSTIGEAFSKLSRIDAAGTAEDVAMSAPQCPKNVAAIVPMTPAFGFATISSA